MDYTVSLSESEAIELATRGQCENKSWYDFRAGRITASKFKAACSTDTAKPSKSLLRAICYPEANKLKSAALEWGIAQEKYALRKYMEDVSARHEQFLVEQCGLIINPEFPWMGASPDSMVSCKCCGLGTVEIKCPTQYEK